MGTFITTREYRQPINLNVPALATFGSNAIEFQSFAEFSSKTFTGMAIGAAPVAGRRVILIIEQATANGDMSFTVTVDGVTPTLIAHDFSSTSVGTGGSIYEILKETGTTCDVAVVSSKNGYDMTCRVYSVTGSRGGAKSSVTGTDVSGGNWSGGSVTVNPTLSVPADGCVIAGWSTEATGSGTATWSALDIEDHDTQGAGTHYSSAHSNIRKGTTNVGGTFTTDLSRAGVLLAATWGPR